MPIRVPSRPEHSPDGSPGARDIGKRVLGIGEDPLGWSVPLISFGRVRLRLHVVFIAWAVGELLVSGRPDLHGPIYMVAAITGFLAVGLFRELVRYVAIRSCGIQNATLVLWPLGVVALPSRPDDPAPRPEIPLAGLLASILVAGIAASVLMFVVDFKATSLLLPLLNPRMDTAKLITTIQIFVWYLYYAAVVIGAANLLVPAPGFDMGRLIQSLLARRIGVRAATRVTSEVGLVVALVLFIVAATSDLTRVMAIAVLVAFVAFIERRRVTFLERVGSVLPASALAAPVSSPLESAADPAWERAEQHPADHEDHRTDHHRDRDGRRLEEEEHHVGNGGNGAGKAGQTPAGGGTPRTKHGRADEPGGADAGIDDLLAKISREGIKSLTDAERARLEDERRRLSDRPKDHRA